MAKKKEENPNTCKWCQRSFSSERTLANHLCAKKKRDLDRDSAGSRIGYHVFVRFYEISTNSKKPKTFDDFISSSYYVDFVKFGWHIVRLNPINRDMFIDYVIRQGIKLKDWCRDLVYITYLNDMVKREPVERALERTILLMVEWAEENGGDYCDFFRKISTNEAAFLIKNGRISPWVLYLSDSADQLLAQFNDEQYAMITPVIDPTTWHKMISAKVEDAKFVKHALKEAGI